MRIDSQMRIAILNTLYKKLLDNAEEITNIDGRDYIDENGVHKEEITIEIVHEDESINIDDLFDESRNITGWK